MADGSTSPEQALLYLKEEPFEDLDYAKIDHHRGIRQGASEVVYGAGKTPEQIRGIVEAMGAKGCRNILVTRIDQDTADILCAAVPAEYHPLPLAGRRISGTAGGPGKHRGGHRRTSDIPVAEEAALTAEAMGNRVTRLYDVGVAGASPSAVQPGSAHERALRRGRGGDGRSSGFCDRRPGGLSGDRGAHQRGIRSELRRTVGAFVHAQLLRLRVQRGEY